jgi:hypothetical protein
MPRHTRTPRNTCALRALTLCDGQVLEDPEHGLDTCLCLSEERCTRAGQHLAAHGFWMQRELLKTRIEEAGSEPLGDNPLPGL